MVKSYWHLLRHLYVLTDRSGGLYALPRPAETCVPRHVCRDADWREPVTVSTLLDVTLG